MRRMMIAIAAAIVLGAATMANGAMAQRGGHGGHGGGGGAHYGGGGGAHFGAGPSVGRRYRGLYMYAPGIGWPYYYYGYGDCYQWQQVWTPYGWSWQQVWVC